MKAVNLLPLERRQGATKPRLAPLAGRAPVGLGAAAAAVAVALGFLVYSASTSVDEKRRELSQVQTELALTKPVKEELSASALASAASRRDVVVSIAQRRVQWDGFLASVSRVIPENVWLAGLTANPSGTATATPAAATASSGAASATTPFAISGYTYSQSSVARLLDRLALVPWLNQVQLTGASRTPLGTRSVFQFSVGASVTTTGGPS